MPNSLATKRALADSLKTLMMNKSINKIKVKEVTDNCGITRRTFYNHFNDTYELLGWIYEHEVIEDIEKYYNMNEWKKAIKIVLDYTIHNKEICLNTYNSLGREYLERFLYNIFSNALKGIINDMTKDIDVEDYIKSENERFYTIGIVGEFILWLRDGLREDVDSVLSRIEILMDDTLYYSLTKSTEKNIFSVLV